MISIIDSCTDPYRNLAAEEYLLKNIDEPVFRLWRNDKAVIVGRNQNAIAEIDTAFVKEHDVAVVRRLTGGGAVFHDLGNLNYTFIDRKRGSEDSGAMFRRFTAPIISSLHKLGVEARLEGRNDLLIDGRKFSGNAMCIHRDRVLQHGTLLFSSSMEDLAGALRTRPEKFIGKSVQSNRSRVTNISEHLPVRMDIVGFIDFLREDIGRECEEYCYGEADNRAIDALAETKYRLDSWNYGQSPRYGFRRSAKFPAGFMEVSMDIEGGMIREVDIRGDYFFKAPTEEFCALLAGTRHTRDKIIDRLRTVAVDDYFCGISVAELVELLV